MIKFCQMMKQIKIVEKAVPRKIYAEHPEKVKKKNINRIKNCNKI